MKRKLFFMAIVSLFSQTLLAQFKYDNVLYKTVYLEDLPKELKKSPNALLIDVRTPGEFSDTSQYSGLNIGHLKGAKNINVRELGKRIGELKDHKNDPIFLYCSHSQRSRVSAKMLADSGFTQVYNVNGAMTEMNLIKNFKPDLAALYETTNAFKIISPRETIQLLGTKKALFILDVRPDSVFNGISKDASLNVHGQLKGAVNIPFSQLESSLAKIPQNNAILIVDSFGNDGIKAAKMLSSKGYSNLNVLFNGMDFWMSENDAQKQEKFWIHSKDYGLISATEFGEKIAKNPQVFILDIRTKEEFTNQVQKQTYRNRGHIENAVNIALSELKMRLNELESQKNKEIIVYAFSNSPESFESAQILADNGFKKVKVLMGGLFNLRAKAANIKGMSHLMKLVVDVPEVNL